MSVDPSAAPVRERGVHSRAGNAMQRTRAAVLDGAVRAVEKHGARRTTMADIAMLAGAVGIWRWRLRRHLRPQVFARLPLRWRRRYAEALGIAVEALARVD